MRNGPHRRSLSGPSLRLSLRRLPRWAYVLYRLMDRSRAFGLAAEMAFWFFLALIPLAVVAGMAAVKLTLRSRGTLAPLLMPLPESVRVFVANELSQVSAWNGGTVGPIAGAVFVWLASSGLHAVFDALELETSTRRRPWWKKRLLAIAGCFGLSLGVAAVGVLGVGLDWFWRLARETVPMVPESERFVARAIRLGVAGLVWLGLVVALYKLGIPRISGRAMPAAPGAILAIVLQLVLGYGYGVYVARLGDGGAYLAGLAIIGVTMIGLYLMALALLAGAELNELLALTRAISRQAARRPPGRDAPHDAEPAPAGAH